MSGLLNRQRKQRRVRLSNHHKLTAKQFWSLVRRVKKKADSLTAASNKKRIEEIVLEELGKI